MGFLPVQRKRKYDLRDVVNAVFYPLARAAKMSGKPKIRSHKTLDKLALCFNLPFPKRIILPCRVIRPNALNNLCQLLFREVILVIAQENGNGEVGWANTWRGMSNAVFNPKAGGVNRIKAELNPFGQGFGGNYLELLLIDMCWRVGHLEKVERI